MAFRLEYQYTIMTMLDWQPPGVWRANFDTGHPEMSEVVDRTPVATGSMLPDLLAAHGKGQGNYQLGDAVADAIVSAVASGLLKPGQRIVEADLAAMLKVSRVPIREAIKILQAQGILNVTPNRGARIAEFDEKIVDSSV